jgi:hypothetical protein
MATLRRGAEKLRQWTQAEPRYAAEQSPENLRVVTPKMWPWFGGRVGRTFNRELLLRQLSAVLESLPAPPVAVTTVPLVADLMGQLRVRRWVYYCVDDFGQWPGLDQLTLSRMEQQVVRDADVLIAASESLRERLAAMGRRAQLLTHGVDPEFWTTAGDDCPELAGLERPLVVFWGLIDRRMDVSFVKRLAADMTRGTIVLVGPTSDADPALRATPRTAVIGPVHLQRLPCIARNAAVLIMPYADLPVARMMQPIKLMEYLATDRPAVARALPATQPWADCLDLADTPDEFSRAVRSRLDGVLPECQRVARRRLVCETWEAKARQFARWVFDDTQVQNAGESLAG